jgi:hypothetical protein
MSKPGGSKELPVEFDEQHICFVQQASSTDVVLMRFADPAASFAILASAVVDGNNDPSTTAALSVTVVRPEDAKQGLAEWADPRAVAQGAAPVYVRYRGVELLWQPARAVLLCDPDQASVLLPAVAEFSYYEAELRRVEQEIAAAWSEVEQDNTLAFDVTAADLGRSDAVGARMERAFRRRIRFARIEPHLESPAAEMPASARKLGEELRERTDVAARAEIVDGQLEVFEHIYEMTSQRMGEYKAARQGHIMEWVIIVLLGAEALLMLLQTLMRSHS